MPARLLYRVRQGLHALLPRLTEADLAEAEGHLDGELAGPFRRMGRRDQRHAIEVMRRLKAAGVSDSNLLVAALLHDCAKDDAPVWLRTAFVLLPGLVERFSIEGAGWRGSAYRLVHHVELSAELAAAAGSTPTTVRLISGRVEAAEQEKLVLLRTADDAS